jgi:hypothetical protein
VPAREVETRQTGFVDGGNIRRGGETVLRSHREGLDLPAADLRQRARRIVDDHVDLAGEERLHRGCRASIRHELEARAGGLLEEHTRHVLRAARTGGAFERLARVRLEPPDESLQVVRRHRVLRDDQIGIRRQKRYRLEIFEHVVRQRIGSAVHHVRAPVADADRVAVRR